MMDLVVVCVLAAGMSLTPPAGWTIEKIEHKAEVVWMEYTEKPHTKVVLRQTVVEGSRVSLPDGCQGEASVKTLQKGNDR